MRRSWPRALFVLVLGGGACHRPAPSSAVGPAARLDAALAPAAVAGALRRAGGGRFIARARFAVWPASSSPDAGAAAGVAGVASTGNLTVDRSGGFHLLETNDHDGGREVVHVGRDLYVAMRYGKMVHRAAEEPEPTRILEQALSAPWTAWDLVGRFAALEPLPPTVMAGGNAVGWKVSQGAAPPGRAGEPELRQWRESVVVSDLTGEIRLDEATGLPLRVQLSARYAMNRGGEFLNGNLDVRTEVEEVGDTPEVERPEAIEVPPRVRTVPDEKALLGRAAAPLRPSGAGSRTP